MTARAFANGVTITGQRLFSPTRLAEVLRLAERAPDEAAAVPELAIVKTGSFAPAPSAPPERLRVVIWNMERGRELEKWLALDAIRSADVLILCEVDDGMARSGNLNVPEEMARRLGMHYAFAPNYFELTRGTRRERRATRGQENSLGFHGNAILSRWPLGSARRIPLPVTFDWFRHYEKRIGTRVGLLAQVELPSGPISVVAAHLEAFATPGQRAQEMRTLLRNVPDSPARALLGGDLNTLGVRPSWLEGLRALAKQWRDASRRTLDVVPFEPLFEEAANAGFSWKEANIVAPTWRFPHATPVFHAKLDWAFVRGLDVDGASTTVVRAPSEGPLRGLRLSDHDGLTLTVRQRLDEQANNRNA